MNPKRNVKLNKNLNKENATPLMRQWFEIKEQYPDHVLIFRVGDFFEMFQEDAFVGAKNLGLTLGQKNKNSKNHHPLAGFPEEAINKYVSKLVRQGFSVVVADQVEDASEAKGLVRRDVVRIVTPGTYTGTEYLNPRKNNFVMYIANISGELVFSTLDNSTGELFGFNTQSLEDFKNEIYRLSPNEILIDDQFSNKELEEFLEINFPNKIRNKKLKYNFFNILSEVFWENWQELISVKNSGILLTSSNLIEYLKELKYTHLNHIKNIKHIKEQKIIELNSNAVDSLELVKALNGEEEGTVLSFFDNCLTPMGSRKLRRWILNPLTQKSTIISRQNIIKNIIALKSGIGEMVQCLNLIGDIERLVGKLGSGSINPHEINNIKYSLSEFWSLRKVILELNLFPEKSIPKDSLEIVKFIERNLLDEPNHLITEGGLIPYWVNDKIDSLKKICENLSGHLSDIEKEESEKNKIPSLKIGYNRQDGYYIEISTKYIKQVPENYKLIKNLKNRNRYITEELKEKEIEMLHWKSNLNDLEYKQFQNFKTELSKHMEYFNFVSEFVSGFDVLLNLANLAIQYKFVCPSFNEEGNIELRDSFHPVSYKILNWEFTKNDASFKNSEFIMLTWPNMAGKSLWAKQIAIILIVSQIGSFVPASYANLPIVKNIFTRVGAKDHLQKNKSTFLVEMEEMAYILKNVTPDSFVIIDELGRGTSTSDGKRIAKSIIHHLIEKIKCKTVFTTHYHELINWSEQEFWDNITNFSFEVQEQGDSIVFTHKLKKWGCSDSYGIECAKLAGIPAEILKY